MDSKRLEFLAKFPLLLNSSFDTQRLIEVALKHLREILQAEAGTVFLLEGTEQLRFWALQGDQKESLKDRRIPLGKGVVGWVVREGQSQRIADVTKDPRFFSEVDSEGGFKTRNILAVPLVRKGNSPIGAIEILNKIGGAFSEEDQDFLEQLSHQIALALETSQLYSALSDRNAKLEILNRRKNDMISVITHEFLTPLGVVQNSAELLASGALDDEPSRRSMAETLQSGVQRLTQLVNQVKNISTLDQQKLEVKRQTIKVADLFDQLEKRFGPICKNRKQKLQFSGAKEVGTIQAELGLILIAFSNLIANGIRFTPDEGSILIGAAKRTGMIEFTVIDTGIGIEANQLPLIFEKFYEVGDVMQHSSGEYEFKSGGLGLGLATVKAILKAHGADIYVESELSEGTRFTFSFPTV